MNNGIFIIAHAPLATALRECVLHVFPEAAAELVALDVQAQSSLEESLVLARQLLKQLDRPSTLVVTDLFGATPCNVAEKLVAADKLPLLAGANLPMLLRAVTYRNEPLAELVARALAGASQGVLQVCLSASAQ